MIRVLLNTEPWKFVVATGVVATGAVIGGVQWQGTDGAVAFASMLLPITLVALSGRVRSLVAACLIGVIAILAEAIIGGESESAMRIVTTIPWISLLLSFSAVVSAAARSLRGTHEERSTTATREVVTRTRRPVPAIHDLETLVPAIRNAANASLGCDSCRVYLLDSTGNQLLDPLAGSADQPGGFVPSAQDGIGAWVLRHQDLWTPARSDCNSDSRFELGNSEWLPAAVAPIAADGEVLGLLVVEHVDALSTNQERVLTTLAGIGGMGIRNAQLVQRAQRIAQHDGLTGLYNHSTFREVLDTLVAEASEGQTDLSLVMSDIDHFKRFNDAYGHLTGDEVLRESARLWRAALPDLAVVARYGGEEFVAALPGVELERAIELAEFLRHAISEHPIVSQGHALQVTASFGVAALRSGESTSEDLIRLADEALYLAKREGRNRVIPIDPFLESDDSTAPGMSLVGK